MRYKEFNNKKVLEDCISLFWKNSFNGTPMSTIVKQTKVNRYSLYHEFENKQGILYEALKLYRERYALEFIKNLNTPDDFDNVLKNFFLSYLKSKTRPAGGFIIFVATELGDNDKHINSFLASYLLEIEVQFVALLNTHNKYQKTSKVIASNLILLFCNSMCYCHIQGEKERLDFITLNLDLILNN